MAVYNQRPARDWRHSGKFTRDGKPMWYSVARRRGGEISADELDNLFDIERVSDDSADSCHQNQVQSA